MNLYTHMKNNISDDLDLNIIGNGEYKDYSDFTDDLIGITVDKTYNLKDLEFHSGTTGESLVFYMCYDENNNPIGFTINEFEFNFKTGNLIKLN